MSAYAAPLRDIRFTLDDVVGLGTVAGLPGFEEATPDLNDNILEEAANIAANTIAPLNRVGDTQAAKLVDGIVKTSPGWNEAWRTLVDGGWNGLAFSTEFGGMGLPQLLNLAVQEMWHSASMAFALCPMLTQGAVNAIGRYGSDEQKARYLPRMVSGEWTGTMDLTESQAGSDLAAVRSRAAPEGDSYRISGQKIFITYGDHDLTENIVHMVLARLPDAPAGVKGISLFVVPRNLIGANGASLGRNDVTCASLEHKLGIHGSPTAVLSFGEKEGALGELIGKPNRGLEYMFAMMNHARLNVGLQGLAIAERSYQSARDYARGRIQGKPLGWAGPGNGAIVHHPDVRRMLLSMKARIEAMRGLLYEVAASHDIAHAHTSAAARDAAQRKVDLLTPIAKGWCTENGIDIASLGVQVFGGMGYAEETGAAQHLRDARITTIYEGTTGIQANDLVGRKVLRDRGAAAGEWIAEITAAGRTLKSSSNALNSAGVDLVAAAIQAQEAIGWLLGPGASDPRLQYAGAVPFLHLMGILAGGHMLLRAAKAAETKLASGDNDPFWTARIALAQFYVAHVMPQVGSYLAVVRGGATAVFAFDESQL
jgi:alkylation response protein AidB-like acyl-CoA dehydrogenase